MIKKNNENFRQVPDESGQKYLDNQFLLEKRMSLIGCVIVNKWYTAQTVPKDLW